MDISSLNQFIKKALDYYTNMKVKYKIFNSYKDKRDFVNNEIIFTDNDNKNLDYQFETLGYFDNTNHVWVWSWVMNDIKSEQINIARGLLNYGLNLEPGTISDEQHIIKALLTNSRIQIEEDIQLETNIAIFTYLIKNRFSFLYQRKVYLNDSKKNYVTFYYLIK